MADHSTFIQLIQHHEEYLAPYLEKTVVIDSDGQPVFNPGACRCPEGMWYLYARVSMRHWTYPGWIRCYRSSDGTNFVPHREHFITPPYTVTDVSFGCEDDRCTRLGTQYAHTFTTILARDGHEPDRRQYDDYVGLALGNSPTEAHFAGIVDLPRTKNASLVETNSHIHLLHRPMAWDLPPSIWSGRFDKGLAEGRAIVETPPAGPRRALPRLTAPRNNRCLLSPLPDWQAYKIGLGAQPVAIGDEWLFTYHVRSTPYVYWWSAGLMAEGPQGLVIRKLLPFPVCFPDTPWELVGDVPRVNFLCGLTQSDDVLQFWTGAADTTVMRVDLSIDCLLETIERHGLLAEELNDHLVTHLRGNRVRLAEIGAIDQDWLTGTLA